MGALETRSAVSVEESNDVALALHMPLSSEVVPSVLVYLRMEDLLAWRQVAKSTESMWASPGHVLQVTRRLCTDLHHARELLEHFPLPAPASPVAPLQDQPCEDAPHRFASPEPKKCLTIGHKGANGHVKGNTMASYIEAVRLGVDIIEFDVLTTVDGVVFCHHDALIEKTGEWIESLTLAQVRKRLEHEVPTFEEMLRETILMESGVQLYVDMKHTEIARPAMQVVLQAIGSWGWTADRFIMASFRQFDLLQVNAFRQAFPELSRIRTACIMDGVPLTLAQQFEAFKVDAISVGKDHVFPDLVADCRRRGIQLWVWTVNSVHFMERLLRLGVDGMCSDFPERVHEAIDKFQSDTAVVSSGDRPPLPVRRSAQAPPSSRDAARVVAHGRRRPLAPESSEQDERLLRKAYGDLALVWDVSARAFREADLTFRACRFASAVTRVLSSGDGGWSAVNAELMGTVELHREVADAIGRWALPTRRSPGDAAQLDSPEAGSRDESSAQRQQGELRSNS